MEYSKPKKCIISIMPKCAEEVQNSSAEQTV